MRTLQQHLVEGAAASGSSSGPTFSLAYDSSSKPGRISTQTGKPMPPGAEFVSKAASKNAKKRANKKAKAAGGGADGDEDGSEEGGQQQAGGSSSGNGPTAAVEAVSQQVRGWRGGRSCAKNGHVWALGVGVSSVGLICCCMGVQMVRQAAALSVVSGCCCLKGLLWCISDYYCWLLFLRRWLVQV